MRPTWRPQQGRKPRSSDALRDWNGQRPKHSPLFGYQNAHVPHPPESGITDAFAVFWHDIAVIVFDAPISGITPADLPPEGLLDEMKADKTLRTAMFTAVGYGVVREDRTGAFGSMFFDGQRRNASQTVLSLQKLALSLSQQPATGDAGTCYGDSGGPHFLGDQTSNLVVSTSSAGDAVCQAAERTYRLDTLTESATASTAGAVGAHLVATEPHGYRLE